MPRGPQRLKPQDLTYAYEKRSGGGGVVAALQDNQVMAVLETSPRRNRQGLSMGDKASFAYVPPEHQRRGIAATMLNLTRHELGYTPVGDTQLSAKGAKWSKAMGLAPNPKGEKPLLWSPEAEMGGTRMLPEVYGHMAEAQRFDPETVRQRAYYKPKRAKRAKETYEQQQLPI